MVKLRWRKKYNKAFTVSDSFVCTEAIMHKIRKVGKQHIMFTSYLHILPGKKIYFVIDNARWLFLRIKDTKAVTREAKNIAIVFSARKAEVGFKTIKDAKLFAQKLVK